MSTELSTCYRHADRSAGVSCQRCDRPICPQCMITASVGFHCPECAQRGGQKVYTASTLRYRPLVTYALIGLNVAVFLFTESRAEFFFDGALNAFAIDRGGEWWRLVTSGFLHFNVLHLGMNMYALWLLGSQLERAAGRLQFAAMYGTALLAGALGALILDPGAFTAGASGAVYGLLGAALAGQRAAGMRVADSPLLGILVINLVFTFAWPNISVGGHLGGLAGGFITGWLVFDLGARPSSRAWWMPVAGCAAIATAVVLASLYVAGNPVT